MSSPDSHLYKQKWVPILSSELFEAQKGALLASLAHFHASPDPAILSLPTGSGKTEVMILLSLLLSQKRTLVVTPSRILRDQTAQRFQCMRVLRDYGLVEGDLSLPVHTQQVQCTTPGHWQALPERGVVVATPKTVSPQERSVCTPPDEAMFDLVLVDEGHHSPANTWRALIRTFSRARVVMLTATPFRRDRLSLPGTLVYHHPIGRAIRERIYRPIEFVPAPDHGDGEDNDAALAKKAFAVWEAVRNQKNHCAILVRTDRIAKANDLVRIYEKQGFSVESVHHQRSPSDNQRALQRLRGEEIDVVVGVGMLGEGLDVPLLNIAVLHSPPRSLAFTAQLLGRISRKSSRHRGPAYLIANPEAVRGEARRLYHEDPAWRDLVPELIDEAVAQARYRSKGDSSHLASGPLKADQIQPFLSARIYDGRVSIADNEWREMLARPNSLPRMPSHVRQLYHVPTPDEAGLIVVVSESDLPVLWAEEGALLEHRWDLHMFYSPPDIDKVVVASTREEVGNPLRARLVGDTQPVAASQIRNALQDAREYTTIGLKNTTGLTGAHPSYRMHIGGGAEGSIRYVDGVVYGAGHALGKIPDESKAGGGVLRGVATNNGRVWQLERHTLQGFLEWAKEITRAMEGPTTDLPGLDFLSTPQVVRSIPGNPVAILLDDRIAWQPGAIRVDNVKGDILPRLRQKRAQSGALSVLLEWHSQEHPIRLSYSPAQTPCWQVRGSRDVRVHIEKNSQEVERGELVDYLDLNPPVVVLPAGKTLIRDTLWETPTQVPIPIESLCEQIAWGSCEITAEEGEWGSGGRSVHATTRDELIRRFPGGVIIKDHGSYEMADFIGLWPRDKVIRFVHCKASEKSKPGVRVGDIEAVCGQACRSHQWIRSSDLMGHIQKRVDERSHCRVVSGETVLEECRQQTYHRNAWTFEVVIVQPGLSIEKLQNEKRGDGVRSALITTHNWLRQVDAALRVWGS